MASFGYEAIDASGKTIKGSLEAESSDEVRSLLKSQGLILVSAKEQGILTKDLSIDIGGYPKARDISVFCRQFVAMTKAGVSILDAIKMLTEQTENKQLKKGLEGVRVNIEKGETLSSSMAQYPKVFPELMVNMVAAGEASGMLDTAIERLAVQFEKTAKTKALVKKALIYPVIVMVVAIAVVIVMLVLVIPKYTEMFKQLGTDLPGITVFVQKASEFIMSYWMILLPAVIAAVVMFKMWSTTDSGKHFFHKIKLSIPVMKNLEVKQASSLMARTLSTLMAAGVPLVEAIEIVATTMENVYFREALDFCKDEIMIGQPLSRPFEECGMFPPMVYHMTKIGEESGNSEEMLTKLADYYDEEVEIAVQSLMAALEPMIIIALAGIVAFLVASCLAPMLEMYGSLNNL